MDLRYGEARWRGKEGGGEFGSPAASRRVKMVEAGWIAVGVAVLSPPSGGCCWWIFSLLLPDWFTGDALEETDDWLLRRARRSVANPDPSRRGEHLRPRKIASGGHHGVVFTPQPPHRGGRRRFVTVWGRAADLKKLETDIGCPRRSQFARPEPS
nr:hypothetical protein Iba_chr05bCG7490 [Ipomoea batatas]